MCAQALPTPRGPLTAWGGAPRDKSPEVAASSVFPDGCSRVVTLPPSDRLALEPFGETICRHTAAPSLAQPSPNGICAEAIDEPGPLISVAACENLVEHQIEVLYQLQRIEGRGMRPKQRPQRFRQAPPPYTRPVTRDLTKPIRRQAMGACQTTLASASETTAPAKNRSCATNVHGIHCAMRAQCLERYRNSAPKHDRESHRRVGSCLESSGQHPIEMFIVGLSPGSTEDAISQAHFGDGSGRQFRRRSESAGPRTGSG
jgi:hypothetical protein